VIPIPDVLDVFKHHGWEGYVTTELYSECFTDPELMLANTARELRDIRRALEI